jgi:response regulator RpfG family c-di-GMP phosphodiesterase
MAEMRILLVEDNPADVRLLREYLLDTGANHYKFFQVSRLADGIECLATEQVDIVLLDLGLPDSQGLDTFYRMHACAPDLPIILLTGLQDERTAAAAVQAGAQDYLEKNDLNQALLERTLHYAIERQRSRQALLASEQRLRKIIDQNSIAIFVLDMKGVILFANPSAAEMFGCRVDELLGEEFGFPVQVEEKVEITIVHAGSRDLSAEMDITQTTWEEGQPVYLVSLHDITARKAAEAAQRKVGEQLSNTLESISDGFLTINQDMVITYYNQAAAVLLNRPIKDVFGRTLLEGFPELKGSIFEEKYRYALTHHTPANFETYFDVAPLKNWYDVRVYPYEDGISVYFQVTTARKRAEEERQWELYLTAALSELYKPLISPNASIIDIAAEALRSACQLTRSSAGFISAFDPNGDGAATLLEVVWAKDGQIQPVERMRGVEIPRDRQGQFINLWGLVLNTHEAFMGRPSDDFLQQQHPELENFHVEQFLAVPVMLGDRLVGQVALINPLSEYTDHDLTATRRVAEFYGLAVQRWEVENALRLARDESQRLFYAERDQRELAETMRDVVSLLVTALDQDTIYRRLLEQVGRVVPFDEAVIYLIDGENIRPVQWLGYERFYPQSNKSRAKFPLKDFPNLSYMLASGLPVLNADTYNHPDWVISPGTAHIRSYAGVPIRVQDQVIGFLNVHSILPGLYTESHLELLTIFGNEAAIALENARLLEETRHRLNELEVINKVSASLRMAETLDQMLPSFIDGLLEVTGTQNGGIFLADPVTNELILTIRRGLYETFTIPPLAPGQGIVGQVYQSGITYFSHDFKTDPNSYQGNLDAIPPDVSGLWLPLRTARETFGVMALIFQPQREPSQDEIHLIETLADIAGNTFHRMRLHEETEVRLQYLSALRTIDLAIATSFDLTVTLNVLLEQTLTQLAVDAADILLYNPILQTLDYKAGRGFYSRAVERLSFQLGQGFAGQAVLENRMIFLPDLRDHNATMNRFAYLAGERFVTYYGVPLMIKGEIIGVLELFQRSLAQPSTEWRDFLDSLARQAAIAIYNNQLFENLRRSENELAMAYDYTLQGWSRALDSRDEETENHTLRVVEVTVQLARRLGINDLNLVHVRRGSILHDIGKMGVPDDVLKKRGPLTDEEWVIMRLHPVKAFEWLSPIAYLRPALDIPYCHHERWDGTGYPRGLKGEQIPKAARIFAVVDVWDALSHDRCYRPAWPMEKVIDYLRDQSGRQFDPRVIAEFLRMLEEEPMIGDQFS